MHPLSRSCTLLLATVLALPAGARTDEPSPAASAAPPSGRAAPATAAPRWLPLPAPKPFGVAAADELLERARGGSDTDIDMRLTGSVSGNSATQVTTGANVITNGSFANMAGIPIVVQNTGANVLIQNATVINLRMN